MKRNLMYEHIIKVLDINGYTYMVSYFSEYGVLESGRAEIILRLKYKGAYPLDLSTISVHCVSVSDTYVMGKLNHFESVSML